MRGPTALGVLAALVFPAWAQEITQSCFPGFCIESHEAFVLITRQPEKGHYRLRVSRTQTVVYVQAGEAPAFPHCDYWCDVSDHGHERRATNRRTGQLMGRLIGPMAPCGGGEASHVHVFVYSPEANPAWFSIVRKCD